MPLMAKINIHRYPTLKKCYVSPADLSETSLDADIPSLPGSPRVVVHRVYERDKDLEQALDFLHHDDEFLIAAELGDADRLVALMKRGENVHQVDHVGRSALHLAVCTGNRHAVLILLRAGVNPNLMDSLGMTPLTLCLMRRPSWRMANMLFDFGAQILPRCNPMDTGLFLQYIMMCTPTLEDEKIIRLLVEKGSQVNDPQAPGKRQTLHFAAMSNNCPLITILIDLGADLFAKNHRNETPRQVAAKFKCKEAHSLLESWEDYFNYDSRQVTVLQG